MADETQDKNKIRRLATRGFSMEKAGIVDASEVKGLYRRNILSSPGDASAAKLTKVGGFTKAEYYKVEDGAPVRPDADGEKSFVRTKKEQSGIFGSRTVDYRGDLGKEVTLSSRLGGLFKTSITYPEDQPNVKVVESSYLFGLHKKSRTLDLKPEEIAYRNGQRAERLATAQEIRPTEAARPAKDVSAHTAFSDERLQELSDRLGRLGDAVSELKTTPVQTRQISVDGEKARSLDGASTLNGADDKGAHTTNHGSDPKLDNVFSDDLWHKIMDRLERLEQDVVTIKENLVQSHSADAERNSQDRSDVPMPVGIDEGKAQTPDATKSSLAETASSRPVNGGSEKITIVVADSSEQQPDAAAENKVPAEPRIQNGIEVERAQTPDVAQPPSVETAGIHRLNGGRDETDIEASEGFEQQPGAVTKNEPPVAAVGRAQKFPVHDEEAEDEFCTDSDVHPTRPKMSMEAQKAYVAQLAKELNSMRDPRARDGKAVGRAG